MKNRFETGFSEDPVSGFIKIHYSSHPYLSFGKVIGGFGSSKCDLGPQKCDLDPQKWTFDLIMESSLICGSTKTLTQLAQHGSAVNKVIIINVLNN